MLSHCLWWTAAGNNDFFNYSLFCWSFFIQKYAIVLSIQHYSNDNFQRPKRWVTKRLIFHSGIQCSTKMCKYSNVSLSVLVWSGLESLSNSSQTMMGHPHSPVIAQANEILPILHSNWYISLTLISKQHFWVNTEQSCSGFEMTGNSQEEKGKREKRERKGHQSRRYYGGQTDRQRGEWAAVGELFGCSEGKAVVCWLIVGMEHLMIICLFSDGLHGIAHLFYTSEPLHVARTEHTHSQRRRWHTPAPTHWGGTGLCAVYYAVQLGRQKGRHRSNVWTRWPFKLLHLFFLSLLAFSGFYQVLKTITITEENSISTFLRSANMLTLTTQTCWRLAGAMFTTLTFLV